MDMVTTATGDLTSTINLTVGTGATGTFGTFDNEHGSSNVTIANDGTIGSATFLADETAGGITMDISGAGSTSSLLPMPIQAT